MALFKRRKDSIYCDGFGNIQLHFAGNTRQIAQMKWKFDPNHARVCVSTDNTDGRSRTIGFQLSPPSAEAYTWPPVVPK